MLRFSKKSSRSRLARTVATCLLLVPGLLSVLLASCATIPPSGPTAGWLAVLPRLTPDSLYASVDVDSSWDLLKFLAETTGNETEELDRIIAKLDRVHARLRLSPAQYPEQGPRVALVAVGSFPTGPVARRLNGDPSWERVMLDPLPGGDFKSSHWSYRTYWRRGELEIAVPEPRVLFFTAGVAASSGAEALLRRFHRPEDQPLPVQARSEPESADIFLYIPDPVSLAVNRSASSAAASSRAASQAQDPGALLQNLPIRQVWISARRQASGQVSGSGAQTVDPQGYELEVVFLLDQVENPRSVELLLRLLLTLWLRRIQAEDPVERLKAATISVDTESARIASFFLADGEIAAFLATLLPESLGSGGLRLQ